MGEEVADTLIAAKADANLTNPKDGGKSALTLASMHGHVGTVRRLLHAGATACGTDDEGQMAAHWALYMEHEEVAEALPAHSSELGSIVDDDGNTPQMLLDALREDDDEEEDKETEAGNEEVEEDNEKKAGKEEEEDTGDEEDRDEDDKAEDDKDEDAAKNEDDKNEGDAKDEDKDTHEVGEVDAEFNLSQFWRPSYGGFLLTDSDSD